MTASFSSLNYVHLFINHSAAVCVFQIQASWFLLANWTKRNWFAITLIGVSDLPLILNVIQVLEKKHPTESTEQIAHRAVKYVAGL